MFLSNEQQLSLALNNYLTGCSSYFPLDSEYIALQNEGLPSRHYFDVMSAYFGLTTIREIPGVGPVPGYVFPPDPVEHKIWYGPARDVYPRWGAHRFKNNHYCVIGDTYMFTDERLVSPGHHDNGDTVTVPGKTWCCTAPQRAVPDLACGGMRRV